MSRVERVILLIDADNVSVDVMEQALRLLHQQHGAVHVRRAYCTPESALKHQSVFKRLAIKPMVNLAAGKNSTDIALAVDAIDLVLAERPDVVVIASSDSDFAPLVQRLREKGCVVRGIGQKGKTGTETQDVYDDFTVLEHRKSEPALRAPTRKTAAKALATAAPKPRAKAAARKAAAPEPPAVPSGSEAPAELAPARKTAARKRSVIEAEAPAEPVKPARKAAPKTRARSKGKASAPEAAAAPAPLSDPRLDALLACLPELAQGQPLALNVAVQRLRAAQLLGRNSSSLKFFAQWGERVELLPPDKPAHVRLRS